MVESKLRAYAHLLATVGLHVLPGQEVVISAELDQPEFVDAVVEECYLAGASLVTVDFNREALMRSHVKYVSPEKLGKLADWQVARWEEQANILPCKLYLLSEDPDGLADVDQEKYMTAMQARRKQIKPIRDRMENKYQWCIAAVPGKAWAEKLFPNDEPDVAVEKLWDAILSCSRADRSPVQAWEEHNAELAARCEKLNSLHLVSLHYTASNGTDLTVGLIPGVKFAAGKEKTVSGNVFNPNIPSEEVFTTPDRLKTNGIVYSSLPLCVEGQLIEDFFLEFKDGKAVRFGAKKNESLLGQLLRMDENASYLGECALVPFSSPIRQSGILFYNTLFDENAACHLALGRGFKELMDGYETLSDEETFRRGMNNSILHEDFMIGTSDLTIVGTDANGKEIPVFRNGEWAKEMN